MGKPRAHLPGYPRESPAQSPGIGDSNADSQPVLPFMSPGLPQSPYFLLIPSPAGGRFIHHIPVTCSWAPIGGGHPLKCGYLLATHCHAAWEAQAAPLAYLCCLSLAGHSESSLISVFQGLPLPTSPGWDGGQPLSIPGPLGTGFTPLPRLISHEAPTMSTCV